MSACPTFCDVKIDCWVHFFSGDHGNLNIIWVFDNVKKLLLNFLGVIMYYIMALCFGKKKKFLSDMQ